MNPFFVAGPCRSDACHWFAVDEVASVPVDEDGEKLRNVGPDEPVQAFIEDKGRAEALDCRLVVLVRDGSNLVAVCRCLLAMARRRSLTMPRERCLLQSMVMVFQDIHPPPSIGLPQPLPMRRLPPCPW